MSKMKIKLKSFDGPVIEESIKKIISVAKDNNADFSGPIPLPTHRERYTILRSVHVNKKSREQFEIRTHKRLIIINDPSDKVIEQIKRIDMPMGVNIELITK
ncbi:MAG: 30S ribosomal protein S10 [Mycoplasma sp.]|nr:30S ribosomal protein S10 [Mycoplasma sp.]